MEKDEPGTHTYIHTDALCYAKSNHHLIIICCHSYVAMIFIEHENSIMRGVRWLEKTTKHQLGLDVVVKTARLQQTKAGARYFVYQCTRYLYNSETRQFLPYVFQLGQQCDELAKQNQGLTSEEAYRRQEMIGTNFIEVYVPNFMMALLREATSFFYIYQFTILWLFYYYDYCK